MSQLTIRQVEVIRAVMMAGTIQGAAELLNVSAPGVSRLVKYSEESLGIRLFDRKGGLFVPAAEAASIFEINGIIQAVQTGAVDAAEAIVSGQSCSDDSVEKVTQAGAMLAHITQAVEAIRDMNRQIATAAEEQTSVAEDISRNITQITTVATANLDNVRRTEAASQNLRGLSGELNEVTARLGG